MLHPREDPACYLVATQREVLIGLIENAIVGKDFFLTGGTALSVFYLHHRNSNDLDLFTRGSVDLGDLQFWCTRKWPGEATTTKESPQFLSIQIRGTKVDFVIDSLSFEESRDSVQFEKGMALSIDSIRSIAANKLCAATNRFEPKDLIDLHFLLKDVPGLSLEQVYADAQKKEAIFDDPPTAAYQIEQNIAFSTQNAAVPWPNLLKPATREDVAKSCSDLAAWIYGRVKL